MQRLLAFAVAGVLAVITAAPAPAQTKITFGYQPVFDLAPVLLAQEKGNPKAA